MDILRSACAAWLLGVAGLGIGIVYGLPLLIKVLAALFGVMDGISG